MLFFSDVHRPFHDKAAWGLMLQVARALKPKHIISNGDFLDCYSISSHSKDPARVGKLKQEIEDGKRGLDDLDALGATNKIFVAGNHSDRLRRYLEEKAPELFGLCDIPGLLGLTKRGWGYVPYKAHTKIGKLFITHDVGSAGRFSTHKALDTYQHSVTTGHSHRLCYVVEGNAVGEYKLSAQFGWMGDINKVDYMNRATARKNWALGFGVGYLDPDTGIVYLTPVPIVRGTCVVNGVLYRATATALKAVA
jgi:predicted phosphodiesterase